MNCPYDFKIIVTGEQFTKCIGMFRLHQSHHSPEPIFEYPLVCSFPEEDVMHSKCGSLEFRGEFTPTCDYYRIYFDVVWKNEFNTADFRPPEVSLVCNFCFYLFIHSL